MGLQGIYIIIFVLEDGFGAIDSPPVSANGLIVLFLKQNAMTVPWN
jgi:hypothetical protein